MSLSSWKQLPFLHYSPIRDLNFNTDSPLFSDPSLTAITASDRHIFFAVNGSLIKIMDLEFNLVLQFIGFGKDFSILCLKYSNVNNQEMLCAVGERPGVPTELKLWSLEKLLSSSQKKSATYPAIVDSSHHYLTSVKIQNGNNQFPLATQSISDDFSVSAFGFTNGVTILVRGNLLNDKGSRQRIIYESNGEPITGLHLFTNQSASEYYLYVLTTSKILLFETTGRNQNIPLNILEHNNGSSLFCNDIFRSNNNLVTSSSDSHSIDFYNFKFGKVNSIQVSKQFNQSRIFNFNDKYLLLVSHVENEFTQAIINNESSGNTTPTSSIVKFNMGTTNSNGASEFKTTKILVLDYTHNFTIFNLTIPSNISNVISVKQDLYLLSSNGILYRLQEKTINEKVQLVIQRSLYPIAIQLIEEELAVNKNSTDISKKDLLLIKKQYGDYLFNKNEFQAAVEQYIASIELKNNSFNLDIILKFKDNDKILYLTEYLEHLCFSDKKVFEKQLIKRSTLTESDEAFVNEDYLTLLLCNYCKLKDRNKLDSFISELEIIKQKYHNPTDPFEEDLMNYSNLSFNIDLIVELLLKINFNKSTLKISFIFKHYSMILDILINHFKKYKLCIIFLRFLKINDIFNVLLTNATNSNYLKTLFKHIPLETTKLLIDIFTGIYKPSISESYIYEKFNSLSDDLNNNDDKAEDLDQSFSSLKVDSSSVIDEKKDNTNDDEDESNVALQSYNAFVQYISSTANNTLMLMNLTENNNSAEDANGRSRNDPSEPTYQPPKPRLVFMSFIDNPNEFVIFLEACLQSYDKFDRFNTNIKDKTDLLITLFEMYLNISNQHSDEDIDSKKSWELKAVNLYRQHRLFMDYNTVLLLCHLGDFSDEDLLLTLESDDEISTTTTNEEDGQSTTVDSKSREGIVSKSKEVKNEKIKAREENTFDFQFNIDDLLLDFHTKESKLPENHPTVILDDPKYKVKATSPHNETDDTTAAYNKIELLRSSLSLGNVHKSIEILNNFGSEIPELYSMTLFFVIKKNSEEFLINEFGLKNFLIILNKLLKSNIISIIDLINILSLNDLVKFKFLKKFLINYLDFKKSEVDKNRKLYDYYTQEITAKKQEIQQLLNSSISGTDDNYDNLKYDALATDTLSNSSGTTATTKEERFTVINNLKCDLCGQKLDFPVVHFMCLHSYHQRCLNDFEYDSYTQTAPAQKNDDNDDNDDHDDDVYLGDDTGNPGSNFKCPKCIGEMEAVSSLRAAQDEIGEKNDLFKIALEESEDKFKVVNDFFGRGAMEHSRFIINEDFR